MSQLGIERGDAGWQKVTMQKKKKKKKEKKKGKKKRKMSLCMQIQSDNIQITEKIG